MRKNVLLLAVALQVWFPASSGAGMSLATKLHKVFKESAYPYTEKMVGLEINTKVDYLPGNKKADDLARADKIHELLVAAFKGTGWREDELAADDLTSRNVELAIAEGTSLKLEETLRLKADGFVDSGIDWQNKGKCEQALPYYRKAIEISPKHLRAYRLRGLCNQATNKLEAAVEDFLKGKEIAVAVADQAAVSDFNIQTGAAYVAKGDYGQANDYYKELVYKGADNAAYAGRLNGVAWFYATVPDQKYLDAQKALTLATQACELTGWEVPSYLDTLAAAQAAAGSFREAVLTQIKAIKRLKGSGGEGEYKKRLDEYLPRLRAAAPTAGQVDSLTGMEFVTVPGGCFPMGDNFGDGSSDEKPAHEVCVDGFALGRYEVTQGQWWKVMGTNPAKFSYGNEYPVEQVSWDEVQTFIGKLNAQSGKNYRLPTEAEWEYAARSGGKQEKYAGGDNLDAVAWYSKNSENSTLPVGLLAPNGLGFYDMSGNVNEWVQDWYESGYYRSSPRQNPTGPSKGSSSVMLRADRVYRGGGWNDNPAGVRASIRDRHPPGIRGGGLGFRLVLPVQ